MRVLHSIHRQFNGGDDGITAMVREVPEAMLLHLLPLATPASAGTQYRRLEELLIPSSIQPHGNGYFLSLLASKGRCALVFCHCHARARTPGFDDVPSCGLLIHNIGHGVQCEVQPIYSPGDQDGHRDVNSAPSGSKLCQ